MYSNILSIPVVLYNIRKLNFNNLFIIHEYNFIYHMGLIPIPFVLRSHYCCRMAR